MAKLLCLDRFDYTFFVLFRQEFCYNTSRYYRLCKEKVFLDTFNETIDDIASEAGGKVIWDSPLGEARRG